MSSPFEDKIWAYISEHRPVKLIFLCVAAIGIIGSAIKTIEPLWKEGSSLANRYLGFAPSPEMREKYGCAFQTGQAYWTFQRVTVLAMQDAKLEPIFSNISTQEIARCEVMFGFSPVISDITPKALSVAVPREVLQDHFANVTNNWNQFQAFLTSKDPKAALLFRIGSELSMAKNGLRNSQASDPKGFLGPLHADHLEDTIKKLESLIAEAQSEFPYSLPDKKLSRQSGEALLRSLLDLEAEYVKYFRGEA